MINIKTYFAMKRHFWQTCRRLSLNPSEIALFLALVDEANEHFWVKEFNVSNGWLTAKIGVSEPTLISARNKLSQYNLISFKSGKSKRKPTKYSITFLDNYLNNFSDNLSSEQQNDTNYLNNFSESFSQSFSESFSQSLRHSKDYKTIRPKDNNTNKDFSKNNFEENFSKNENFENPMEIETSEIPVKTEISPSKKVATKKVSQDSQVDELELPFESEEFRENWLGFRQARREMKKPITLTAAKMIFKKLERFGEQVASKALEDSATNGWQGVFPENIVKQQTQTTTKNNSQPKNLDFENADYTRTTLK